ncbi:hypothetical protein [Marinobacterium arenosum]|uniref:hypothetical protein n=1 Tax=Marinobacterium arenosum TaxID=2862496 RepID=UPI001C97ABD0|nr:hypothetical protein [Marinobacterium arenosum]MBY4676346.1 hypothetical protein [Marinobacterium arenosum]
MFFLIRTGDPPELTYFAEAATLDAALQPDDRPIRRADDLLQLYFNTDENDALQPLLRQVRQHYLDDLNQVAGEAEIKGLMMWLLIEHGVDNRGESLAQTADRLSELDLEQDSDSYSNLIFHLNDAIERLEDLELEGWED